MEPNSDRAPGLLEEVMAAGLELVNRLEGVELPPAAERARLWLLTVIDAGEDLFPRCQGRTTVQRETLPGPDGGAQGDWFHWRCECGAHAYLLDAWQVDAVIRMHTGMPPVGRA